MTNTYTVIDNFLPAHEFAHLKELMMSSDFVWHYNDYSILPGPDHDDIPQFIHNFIYIDGTFGGVVGSPFAKHLNPLFDRIDNLATILRCKANLTMKNKANVTTGFHRDTERPFTGFTAVLYINDTNGGTTFEDGETVECKANRFLAFDNRMIHSGITCTDQERRVLININYTVWDES